ncbi:G protein-coupled glucose receptor regulating Gpa2-domain-containing protein [Armillaria luteobubalina]|uniref:G protein-coupled glucose receptor regulating Gpa2-domain-containing protein n=1 Tax=Armillaria luteobubalina TaxID=153913 RepID=A0AA39NVP8_9AGAR|nr:G protein-coupled glucose receptor regulating Gpa2-domain-containing protein [Armillaria luteobubalina]
MALGNFELALAITNFVGSALSAMGSGFIILCYVFLPMKKHYRHPLIINLAVADFINGVNNGISGAVVLAKGPLTQSPACTANGFIGQLSVQATDTSILAIAVVTVLIVIAAHESWLGDSKKDKMRFIIIVCACTWVMPLMTSFIALGKGYYTAVSGNWCWITAEPVYLRYVLTHAWRFLFIFIEIGLYTYLYLHLRKRFKDITVYSPRTTLLSRMSLRRRSYVPKRASISKDAIQMRFLSTNVHDNKSNSPIQTDNKVHFPISSPSSTVVSQSSTPGPVPAPHTDRYKHISKILLLNAYPIAYIILWIPGLCNRLVEASGHSSKVLQIMQASTQFVGFANALTYGWNENMARSVRDDLRRKFAPSQESV